MDAILAAPQEAVHAIGGITLTEQTDNGKSPERGAGGNCHPEPGLA